MKVAVIGASGGIGRHVVTQALARGHDVTAFLRRPSALGIEHGRLRLVEGDALTGRGLKEAVIGSVVVISCLGSRTPARVDPVTSAGTRHVLEALRDTPGTKLLVVSSVGLGRARDNSTLVNVLVRPAFALFFAPARDDFNAMEALVTGSAARWTIVRASSLTDGPARARYRVDVDPRRVGPFIARADVARFLLEEAESDNYANMRVSLSNGWSQFFARAPRLAAAAG